MLIICFRFLLPRSAIDTIHGAGETIRGTINDGLDSAGEGLRNADSNDSTAKTSDPSAFGKSSDYDNSGNHQGVAEKGTNEFKQGVEQLQNTFSSNSTTSSSTTHPST